LNQNPLKFVAMAKSAGKRRAFPIYYHLVEFGYLPFKALYALYRRIGHGQAEPLPLKGFQGARPHHLELFGERRPLFLAPIEHTVPGRHGFPSHLPFFFPWDDLDTPRDHARRLRSLAATGRRCSDTTGAGNRRAFHRQLMRSPVGISAGGATLGRLPKPGQ